MELAEVAVVEGVMEVAVDGTEMKEKVTCSNTHM